MFGQLKSFGAELKNVFKPLGEFGKSLSSFVSGNGIFKMLGRGFSALGKGIGSLVSGITRAAISAGTAAIGFLAANAKTIAIAAVIGLIVYGLIKLFSWLLGRDNVDYKQPSMAGEGDVDESIPKEGYEVAPEQKNNQQIGDSLNNDPLSSSNMNKTSSSSSSEVPKILPMSTGEAGQAEAGAAEYTDYPQTFRRMNRAAPVDLNKMSTDFATGTESKPSTIIANAPSSQNVINNNNTTQSVSMVPVNQDRSFINLNSIPI
jgi:hypothetical protein